MIKADHHRLTKHFGVSS